MKQITILGATSLVGKKLIKKALTKGIKIKALVKNKEEIQEYSHSIEIIEGNYFNKNTLEQALKGAQIVVSVIEPTFNNKLSKDDEDKYINIFRFILKQMQVNHQNRWISISNAGVKMSNEHLPLARKLLRVKIMETSKSTMNVRDRELYLIEQSKLDWTVVRAPAIKEKVEGKFVADNHKFVGAMVDSNQLSDFMLSEILNKKWIKKAPVVGTK
ncbi:NAD(P)H-binding protein [Lutibacter sp. TH_r2]|uniref:NAD(P)H-binding protein n=1 Tax=Lutibacter sp. TH_r2 TaxID=3082083 RepID=UPI0029540EF2|nr:NAD(P)H-binding protein [Lutibacter sp. TH_r2]MDV7186210.1 NAD(P)H-binding protein [Lutibacter sp. TH_r2]